MKNYLTSITVAGLFILTSCGGATETKTENTENATVVETTAAPTITIDATSWVATDLSTVSLMIPVILNLPKDAKMEKNGNGGVDIKLNEAYTITVSNIAVSNIKEAIESDKSLTVNNTSSYKNGKVSIEEPNGFVYSMQMIDESNGTKYEPEAHFYSYLEKDGAIYSINDVRPMDNFFLSGNTYTEANAKTIYDVVKSSAKMK